jgi:hypothetical protein
MKASGASNPCSSYVSCFSFVNGTFLSWWSSKWLSNRYSHCVWLPAIRYTHVIWSCFGYNKEQPLLIKCAKSKQQRKLCDLGVKSEVSCEFVPKMWITCKHVPFCSWFMAEFSPTLNFKRCTPAMNDAKIYHKCCNMKIEYEKRWKQQQRVYRKLIMIPIFLLLFSPFYLLSKLLTKLMLRVG